MPAAARCTPPVTGDSSVSMPFLAPCAASRWMLAASLVLISIQVPPGASPSSTPPSPPTTASTASGEGRQVMTVSDACAISRMESAHTAPFFSRSMAHVLSMSYTVSGKPACRRLPARCLPRAPSPM